MPIYHLDPLVVERAKFNEIRSGIKHGNPVAALIGFPIKAATGLIFISWLYSVVSPFIFYN